MLEQIDTKIVEAVKAKNMARASALKLVKSELINNQKSKKPQEELKVVQAYHKKLNKSLDLYEDGTAVKDSLVQELKIIEELLPKQMSEDELVKFIRTCFQVHLNYEDLSVGEIIGKIKKATGSNNGQVIAREVKKHKDLQG